MNLELLERLLYEEESDSLDFKSEQYRFINVTDVEKSELLKDILAFANSWCRMDAFILVGVKEIKGGRSAITGVGTQIDDANLQEFVNKKAHKPINFSYESLTTPEGDIGIIRIPRQQRPFYLRKDFGKLTKNTVYVRRGSSTDIAAPDEIAQMGKANATIEAPSLDLSFANPETGAELGKYVSLKTKILEYDETEVPNYGIPRSSAGIQFSYSNTDNTHFYREYAAFVKSALLLGAFRLAVKNNGSVLISNVRVKLKCLHKNSLIILDKRDYPEKPSKVSTSFLVPSLRGFESPLIKRRTIHVKESKGNTSANCEMLDIQPKDVVVSEDKLFFGGSTSGEIKLFASVFADNLPEPATFELTVAVEAELSPFGIDRYLKAIKDDETGDN